MCGSGHRGLSHIPGRYVGYRDSPKYHSGIQVESLHPKKIRRSKAPVNIDTEGTVMHVRIRILRHRDGLNTAGNLLCWLNRHQVELQRTRNMKCIKYTQKKTAGGNNTYIKAVPHKAWVLNNTLVRGWHPTAAEELAFTS
eukprot:5155162-Pleurochrysis_carterae.AAC.1